MRSDRDMRTESEREIDDFLSKFETPVDELSADVNSYLENDSTDLNAAPTKFYGNLFGRSGRNRPEDKAPAAPSPTEANSADESASAAGTSDPAVSEKEERKDDTVTGEPDNGYPDEPVNISSTNPDSNTAAPARAVEAAPVTVAAEIPKGVISEDAADEAQDTEKKSPSINISGKAVAAKLFMKPNKNYDPSKPESYEENGKTVKNKPMRFSFKKLILDCIALGCIMVLCVVIYTGICIVSAPKYDFHDIYADVDTSSVIFDDQGKQIDSVFYTQNRKVVKYEDMPEDLINAVIAIEDKTFWKHHGFNWVRMVGAVLSSVGGNGRISGTSTITQQLARNVYLSDTKSQRSIKRKLLEMYYAARIEHALSKEEIVEAYLNSIYLGFGCYGVDAAAKTYFSCPVEKLNLIQCATLAALPKAPNDYALLKYKDSNTVVSEDSKVIQSEPDTIVTNDISKDRRDLTLALMLDQGLITKKKYDKNVGKALNSYIKPHISSGNGNYSYFHEYIVDTVISDLMEEYDMEYADAERMVYTKGLQIYSTMDSTAQNAAATEFKDPSNFPSVSAIYKTDADGNMLNNDGDIALYSYDHFFDENGDYRLTGDDVRIKKNGSVVIKKGRNLNIYETTVDNSTDYSLEFKNYYRVIDGLLYSYQGGYINIPASYKSLNSKGNLVISSDFFKDEQYDGYMRIEGSDLVITEKGYSLSSKTLQPQGAMVIAEVGTGKIKAMVGGRAFNGQKLLNRALNSRQPGSSIKPLAVYGAALQKSYELQKSGKKWTYTDYKIDKQGTKGWGDYVTVHSSIEDEKTHIEGRDWPDNVTRSFLGKNTFRTAVQKSINTCAVKLQLQIGADYSMEQLKKFNITTAVDDESNPVNDLNPAALALGAMCQGVKPLEMALAYASFPGNGQVCTPVCYTKVVDRKGDVLLEGNTKKTEALNSGVSWIMTDVLKSVVRANGYIHLDNGCEAAGKTGTTNERYDIWFDGFTPTYAAALWIGTDQNVEMASGSTAAAQLWGKIMNQIPAAINGSYPDQPSNVISYGGEYYTQGTETGLTSWSNKDEEKKKKEAALKKWKAEREKHKKWVVDEEGHYKIIHHDEKFHYEDDHSKPIYGDDKNKPIYEEQDDPSKPIYDENGDITGYEKKKVITGYEKKIVGYEQKKVVDKKAYDEKGKWIKEKGHWEYAKGYRDGDFKG